MSSSVIQEALGNRLDGHKSEEEMLVVLSSKVHAAGAGWCRGQLLVYRHVIAASGNAQRSWRLEPVTAPSGRD